MTCVFVCLKEIWICLKKELSLSSSRTLTFWSFAANPYTRIAGSTVLSQWSFRRFNQPDRAKPNFPRIRSWQTNDMLISVPTCSRLQLLVGQNPLAEVLRFCDSAVFRKTCQRFSHTHFHSWSQLNPARRVALSVLVWLDPGFGIYKIAQVVPGTEIPKYRNRNRTETGRYRPSCLGQTWVLDPSLMLVNLVKPHAS